MNLSGKRVLLTGASGGLGQALAFALSAVGAELILTGRRRDALDELANQLRRGGGRAEVIVADLRRVEDQRALAQRCAERELPVDVLILNAGVNRLASFLESDARSLAEVLAVDLHAPMQLVHQCLPALKLRPEASVLFVNSTFGRLGHPGYAAYCAAKHGLKGFAEALRREFRGSTVQIQELSPRTINTPMNDAGAQALSAAAGAGVDTPSQVAAAAIRQLQSGRARVQLGFPERIFVHLNHWFPALLDRVLGQRWPRYQAAVKAAANHPPTAHTTQESRS